MGQRAGQMPGLQSGDVRVALLQATDGCPAWLVRAHALLREAGFAGITNVWSVKSPLAAGTRRLAKLALSPIKYLERRSYNPSHHDALELGPGIPGAERRPIACIADLERALAECAPDILLCEARCPIEMVQPVAAASGCRTWVLDESWSDVFPTSYTRRWLSRAGSVETTLSEIGRDGIRRSLLWTRSQVAPVSLSVGIHRHFWKVAHLPLRALLSHAGNAIFSQPQLPQLSTRELFHVAGAQLHRRCKERVLRLDDPTWALAIGKQTEEGVMASMMHTFTPILPPPCRFWADPFIAVHGGRHYVFFEEYLHSKGRGHIVVAEVDSNGLASEPVTVLDMSWHLSYPQIFRHNGTWYMLPESGAERRLDLYRAEEFPHRWVFDRTLIEGIGAYDSTLLRHRDKWWLFSTVTDGHGVSASDELHIHFADELLSGPWTAHAANPVVSDATGARPGGSFFWFKDRLFRPAQDSSGSYGYGLVIHEIDMLTESTYREHVDRRILPESGGAWRGIHTYNANGGLAVVDFLLSPRAEAAS